ncbi:hypothetical protein Trydic_g12199 [Trypoxylus dichotomus]
MSSVEIRNIEDLIAPLLKPGQQFASCEVENLLPAGENYGSVMLRIEVKVRNSSGDQEILHCVAKTCPPSPLLWEIFNTKVSFKKEIAIYTTIVPTLNDFAKEKGIDNLMNFFAKPIAARISLDPESKEVDKDAVILLENLKVQGYDTGDRFVGFDEETTKYLLRELAIMHATPIAYRSANPEGFKSKILPYLSKNSHFKPSDDVINDLIRRTQNAVSGNPKCVPHLSKIETALREMYEVIKNPPATNDLFITIAHNDFWVNNTMLKYEGVKPIGNKIVDFQIIEYSSLANDVLFFLYTSVDLRVLEEKVDELIKLYYDQFIGTLVRLKHDVSAYSFKAMLEDFAVVARSMQFTHVSFMLTPIMILKGKAVELSELKADDILMDESALHENYHKKLEFLLLDFVKRGWI